MDKQKKRNYVMRNNCNIFVTWTCFKEGCGISQMQKNPNPEHNIYAFCH